MRRYFPLLATLLLVGCTATPSSPPPSATDVAKWSDLFNGDEIYAQSLQNHEAIKTNSDMLKKIVDKLDKDDSAAKALVEAIEETGYDEWSPVSAPLTQGDTEIILEKLDALMGKMEECCCNCNGREVAQAGASVFSGSSTPLTGVASVPNGTIVSETWSTPTWSTSSPAVVSYRSTSSSTPMATYSSTSSASSPRVYSTRPRLVNRLQRRVNRLSSRASSYSYTMAPTNSQTSSLNYPTTTRTWSSPYASTIPTTMYSTGSTCNGPNCPTPSSSMMMSW